MPSCIVRFLAYEASSADHPVGFLFPSPTAVPDTATTTTGAQPPSESSPCARHAAAGDAALSALSQTCRRASRAVDTWDDLLPSVRPRLMLTSIFLDIFTALQVLFGYFTLALWNYLSTHRDVMLIRYGEAGGQCYAQCQAEASNVAVHAVADVAAPTVRMVPDHTSAFCVTEAGCHTAPGALAAAYLAVVSAGLMLLVGTTLTIALGNTACVVHMRETRWLRACRDQPGAGREARAHAQLPVMSLAVPRYCFVDRVYWHALDGLVATAGAQAEEDNAVPRRGESDACVDGAVDEEEPPARRHPRDCSCPVVSDCGDALFWYTSPLVLVLVVLDGLLLTWARRHPAFSRIPGTSALSSSAPQSQHSVKEGTVTLLQGFVLALGVVLLLYTVRRVVLRALCGCVRGLVRVCLRCVTAVDGAVAA